MTKPFILLQARPEDEASEEEYASFCEKGGLRPDELVRVRLDAGDYPWIELGDYSGIIMGGGPHNFATLDAEKSRQARAYEAYIMPLLGRIVESDTPFLGACLGVGALVVQQGGSMSFSRGEPVGAVDVALSDEGQADPLLQGVASQFRAFVGHKEGISTLPVSCTMLAYSSVCYQMIRVGRHVYATQFHPELDADALALRINVYQDRGYFEPDEANALILRARRETVNVPQKVLRNFVTRYRQT